MIFLPKIETESSFCSSFKRPAMDMPDPVPVVSSSAPADPLLFNTTIHLHFKIDF